MPRCGGDALDRLYALYVAAKLGVADLIADEARSVEELAVATRTDAPSLRRGLRALASAAV